MPEINTSPRPGECDHQAKQKKRRKKTDAEREAERAKREAEPARIAQYYKNPNQVLTFAEWCLLNTISKATGKRIIDSGAGPVLTDLAPRRVGIAQTLTNRQTDKCDTPADKPREEKS
jgi:hypothetical protein